MRETPSWFGGAMLWRLIEICIYHPRLYLLSCSVLDTSPKHWQVWSRVAVTSPVDAMWKHSNAHEVCFGIGAVQFMYMVQGVAGLSNNTGTYVWPEALILWEIWLESWCVACKQSTQVAKLRFVFRPRSTNFLMNGPKKQQAILL